MTIGEKLSATDFEALCLAVDAVLIQQHLDWLGNDFFSTFDTATISGHLGALAGLSDEAPVEVLLATAMWTA